jgi:hypothetical protein
MATAMSALLRGSGACAIHTHVAGGRRAIQAVANVIVDIVFAFNKAVVDAFESSRFFTRPAEITDQIFIDGAVGAIFRGFTGGLLGALERRALLLLFRRARAITASISSPFTASAAPAPIAITTPAASTAFAASAACIFFALRPGSVRIDFRLVVVNQVGFQEGMVRGGIGDSRRPVSTHALIFARPTHGGFFFKIGS